MSVYVSDAEIIKTNILIYNVMLLYNIFARLNMHDKQYFIYS